MAASVFFTESVFVTESVPTSLVDSIRSWKRYFFETSGGA